MWTLIWRQCNRQCQVPGQAQLAQSQAQTQHLQPVHMRARNWRWLEERPTRQQLRHSVAAAPAAGTSAGVAAVAAAPMGIPVPVADAAPAVVAVEVAAGKVCQG
jgi:hypothetical protein